MRVPTDDPISAIQALNDSDQRQRSPVLLRLAKEFLDIVKLFAAPGGKVAAQGMSAALDWLGRQSQQNTSDLVAVLADELKYRGAQIEQLRQTSEDHRQFLEEDMPGLVLDGLLRVESVRAKDRIKRIGRILVHAAEVGRHDRADYAEEMLRIAIILDDRDVLVLREIVRVQRTVVDTQAGRASPYNASSRWGEVLGPLKKLDFTQGEVDSVCAKLESCGLVSRTERNVNALADKPAPYALLQKGVDFVEYIRSSEDKAHPAPPS